jgi:hypothetical protein
VTFKYKGNNIEYQIDLSSVSSASRLVLSNYFKPGNKVKIRGAYCGSSGAAWLVYIEPSD